MSRDVYEKDYYTTSNINRPMPIRWMAVESMKEGIYSTKSDVVSIYSKINHACDNHYFNVKNYCDTLLLPDFC